MTSRAENAPRQTRLQRKRLQRDVMSIESNDATANSEATKGPDTLITTLPSRPPRTAINLSSTNYKLLLRKQNLLQKHDILVPADVPT